MLYAQIHIHVHIIYIYIVYRERERRIYRMRESERYQIQPNHIPSKDKHCNINSNSRRTSTTASVNVSWLLRTCHSGHAMVSLVFICMQGLSVMRHYSLLFLEHSAWCPKPLTLARFATDSDPRMLRVHALQLACILRCTFVGPTNVKTGQSKPRSP